MIVERVSIDEWNKLSSDAHRIAFNEDRDPSVNTFHYCLVVFDESKIRAYATILEMDKGTAHMQHGGAMPETKGTVSAVKAYSLIMSRIRESYKRVTTHILNTNVPMLKLALSEGFRIIGCDYHDDGIYLHLYQEFKGA